MNSKKTKVASWALALALGAVPVAVQAQSKHPSAHPAEVSPAVPQQSSDSQLSEAQWLRQRVETLEAALASAEKCVVKRGSAKANSKDASKAGTGGSGRAPADKNMAPTGDKPMVDDKMEPMDDKMPPGGMSDM